VYRDEEENENKVIKNYQKFINQYHYRESLNVAHTTSNTVCRQLLHCSTSINTYIKVWPLTSGKCVFLLSVCSRNSSERV
jgi:hypothetical protein